MTVLGAAATIATASVGLWLAALVADQQAHRVTHGALARGRELRAMLYVSSPLLLSAVGPLVLLGVSALGAMGLETALLVAAGVNVATLFAWGCYGGIRMGGGTAFALLMRRDRRGDRDSGRRGQGCSRALTPPGCLPVRRLRLREEVTAADDTRRAAGGGRRAGPAGPPGGCRHRRGRPRAPQPGTASAQPRLTVSLAFSVCPSVGNTGVPSTVGSFSAAALSRVPSSSMASKRTGRA